MANFKIWTFNRATPLIGKFENDLKYTFRQKGHTLTFGDRSSFNNNDYDPTNKQKLDGMTIRTASAQKVLRDPHIIKKINRHQAYKHRLMHEGEKAEEYFVPIPLKCLGWAPGQQAFDQTGQEILNNIIECEKNAYFQDRQKFDAYWNTGNDNPHDGIDEFKNMRMNTLEQRGYYDILREATPPNTKNILIGYSQGGLVARYLAFVDEYIFKENLVDVIITVGSANYGSPLANPNNADSVTRGLIQLIPSLLNTTEEKYPNFFKALSVQEGYSMPEIHAILEGLVIDKNELKEDTTTLRSMKKWLSGLHGNPNTAFANLNLSDIGEPGSVLYDVQNYPLKKSSYGSVINTDNTLAGLIKDFLPNNVIGWLLGSQINKLNTKAASKIYNNKVLSQHYSDDTMQIPEVQNKIKQYNEGIPKSAGSGLTKKIKKTGHDFVIPSSYMVLPPGEKLLQNYVNNEASHVSGGRGDLKAGRENRKAVFKMLENYI